MDFSRKDIEMENIKGAIHRVMREGKQGKQVSRRIMDEVYPDALEEVLGNGQKKRREPNEMAEVEIIAPSDGSFEEKDY